MKKSLPSLSEWHSSRLTGLTPEELERTLDRMEMYDAMCPQERELVQIYGLARGMAAARLFYGRWDEARAYLEKERQQLQVQRFGSITLAGLRR